MSNDFESQFRDLTGNLPFPWQSALYERFSKGDFPHSASLPTGLGKTNVIAVWLIALANHPEVTPRRLVYVVNRRTVVDQTTDEVEKFRKNLESMPEMKQKLGGLALSTLRGQFADNREWSADPSKPAVICGTVDMIGSRLLFCGYGIGWKQKPLHAGFLGQDVLLVHDEAHLEPAFQKLLIAIQEEQERCQEFGKFYVLELSATTRGTGKPLRLTDKDRSHLEVKKRIGASKSISLHESQGEKLLADEISQQALELQDSKQAILVFVRKVEDVEKIVAKLLRVSNHVKQLTGTMRGRERETLIETAEFRRFLPKAEAGDETVYLVCTSAGEVGVNISADHLLCDLSTFDSMAQRFGRVNRFGTCIGTQIHIFYPDALPSEEEVEAEKKKDKAQQDSMVFVDAARRRTLELLQLLDGNGSATALETLDPDARLAAFAPPPEYLETSSILFDSWALTTIREKLPGRPMVERYLHGISGWEPSETHVAWREEVGVVVGDLLEPNEPIDLIEEYPLKPHELLRDNSTRVFDRLKKLEAPLDTPVWIVAEDDSVVTETLGGLINAGGDAIASKTVLLPPSAGGLRDGMLTGDSNIANDVADELWDKDKIRRRVRVWDNDPEFESKTIGMRLIRIIDTHPDTDADLEEEPPVRRYWHWFESPKTGDGDGSKSNQYPVLWQVHVDDVIRHAKQIVANLSLSDDLKQAIIIAAQFHDHGKRRKHFQRILGNFDAKRLLSKSGKRGGFVAEQYRHEFGSLLDVKGEATFQGLNADIQDLILHLIAVHHGRGRPHFPSGEANDTEPKGKNVEEAAAEVPRRYVRLQRKYGRWGLAYLESLLRAADYAASANPSAFVEKQS